MTDQDIYAFNPAPAAPATPPKPTPPPRRIWPWVLGGLLLLVALAIAAGTLTLVSLLDGTRDAVHINIDGEDLDFALHDGVHGVVALLAVAGGLVVALLAVFCVVPLTLLLVALGLMLGFGGALLGLGLVAALVLSPLWALLLLLWLVLRKPRRAARMQP